MKARQYFYSLGSQAVALFPNSFTYWHQHYRIDLLPMWARTQFANGFVDGF